ncbi:MAG: hypothetical protein OK439_05285, partial [Thaumarchaeota archaeon]|nr:hypothetical protein [Nitrososphaerota archaeon]
MLRISGELAKLEGVNQAAAVMATPLNKKILKDIGFTGAEIETTRADDMIVAVEAIENQYLNQAFSKLDELLSSKAGTATSQEKVQPKTLNAALSMLPEANMAVISVPGEFASREASNALNNGLNVFLFSSNVAIEDEYELKKIATSRGLLMKGPDCGTSIINNIVLGF